MIRTTSNTYNITKYILSSDPHDGPHPDELVSSGTSSYTKGHPHRRLALTTFGRTPETLESVQLQLLLKLKFSSLAIAVRVHLTTIFCRNKTLEPCSGSGHGGTDPTDVVNILPISSDAIQASSFSSTTAIYLHIRCKCWVIRLRRWRLSANEWS